MTAATEREVLAQRLAELRRYVVGTDVPVALVKWMEEVEAQLDGMRAVVEYAASMSERATQDSFGLRVIG